MMTLSTQNGDISQKHYVLVLDAVCQCQSGIIHPGELFKLPLTCTLPLHLILNFQVKCSAVEQLYALPYAFNSYTNIQSDQLCNIVSNELHCNTNSNAAIQLQSKGKFDYPHYS